MWLRFLIWLSGGRLKRTECRILIRRGAGIQISAVFEPNLGNIVLGDRIDPSDIRVIEF